MFTLRHVAELNTFGDYSDILCRTGYGIDNPLTNQADDSPVSKSYTLASFHSLFRDETFVGSLIVTKNILELSNRLLTT